MWANSLCGQGGEDERGQEYVRSWDCSFPQLGSAYKDIRDRAAGDRLGLDQYMDLSKGV